MTCNCMTEMKERVDARVKEGLTEKGEKFEDYDSNWHGKVFRLDGKKNDVMMDIKYEYQGFKVNKEPKARRSKDSMHLAMSFCPFCGVEYNPEA